jgi:hypothetical protein
MVLLIMQNNTTTKPLNQNNMKAKLTFNLPEDQAEFDLAVQGSKMYVALWDISQELRTLWKYEELKQEEWDMVERIRNKFFEILDENQIKLDK